MRLLFDLSEVAFVLLALVGVALVHVPTALVLAGVLGVVACEREAARRADRAKLPAVKAPPE